MCGRDSNYRKQRTGPIGHYGRFGASRRSFALPRTVHAEGIKAEFDNGLLSVRLPKADEAMSRKIEVSRKS
ncbi:MAG: Hsp20/alpha crystallin family protein [Gemmatimonadota bacterium]|nr:Hsp20/alpha crystallin family protein [Gemmatimonadota bacterium]